MAWHGYRILKRKERRDSRKGRKESKNGNLCPLAIEPTLVRMAQEGVVRKVLIDKQGNFGSIAGMSAEFGF